MQNKLVFLIIKRGKFMSDSKESLICPACGNEMEKVFIKSRNIYIDICIDGCGGIFFDNREFERFDEQNENADEILEAIKDKNFEKTDESKPRICPVCSSVMVKNYASAKQGVQIDCCYTCGGKFLDNNELVKIRNQYSNEEEKQADYNALFEKSGIFEAINNAEKDRIEAMKGRSKTKKFFDKKFEFIRDKFNF